jgi:hypothetical protein
MAKEPTEAAVAKISDTPRAPIIFFDDAPVFNNYNGIIGVTLTAGRAIPDGAGGIIGDTVVVAFLRGNIQAAVALRNAIDSALLLGAKTGQAN